MKISELLISLLIGTGIALVSHTATTFYYVPKKEVIDTMKRIGPLICIDAQVSLLDKKDKRNCEEVSQRWVEIYE